MQKIISLILFLIFVAPMAFAEDALVGQELSKALKSQANEPNMITVVFSLLFVVLLIYITGVIYSKLRIHSAKKIKEQLKDKDLGSVVVLSTTQLGQGKNLHVVEVEGSRILIGATPSSINLIRELDESGDKKNCKSEENNN